jgi:uncharacterized membrane protein YkvA (DUF1232 family)
MGKDLDDCAPYLKSLSENPEQTLSEYDLVAAAKAVARSVPFVRDALASYHAMMDEKVPSLVKAGIALPLAYFALPFDALPDFIVALGYTDDAAVFSAAFATFRSHITAVHYTQADETLGVNSQTDH